MKLEMEHGREYFSPSQLKKLYISLGQFRAYLSKQFVATKAMNLGSAVHCAILEPDKFNDRFLVFDDAEIKDNIGGKRPTATAAYRNWLIDYQDDNKDKLFISMDEMEIITIIKMNCAMSGVTDTYFTGGEAEKTIRGVVRDYDTDFDALCIVDYDTEFMSVDLKTTSKPLNKFKWDANDLGYDIQAKLTNSINKKDFVFVVVQTVSPYDIGIYSCSDVFMNQGTYKINKALDNYDSFEDESPQVLNFEL